MIEEEDVSEAAASGEGLAPEKRVAGRKRVTFRIHAPEDSEVYVAGTFNEWRPRDKRLSFAPADGTFSAVVLLPKGTYEYKFIVNDIWCVDPECPDWAPNGYGSLNSVLHVT